MIDEPTALRLAGDFLRGKPGGDGPFRVRAEQDAWIVCTTGPSGETIMIYIDIEDGLPSYYSETVVDVELRKPG